MASHSGDAAVPPGRGHVRVWPSRSATRVVLGRNVVLDDAPSAEHPHGAPAPTSCRELQAVARHRESTFGSLANGRPPRASRGPAMHEAVESTLKAWESFYVIVGSAAGALTGLQFVVMTLIAEAGAAPGRKESISAFGSPNVVHFCAGLLVASILSVPWSGLRYAGVAVAGCGALGVVYSGVVLRRALRQGEYRPVFEDWLWHTILPMLAYAAL